MHKKGLKLIVSTTLMALILTTALTTNNVKAAAIGQRTRISGINRYETAKQVSISNFTTSENIVLTSGEGYADSISASVLAKKLNAPIVLTDSKSLNSNAKSAIETLKAKNIFIIGGETSISKSIENQLKSNYTVKRLSGSDRYATNLAVAKYLADELKVSKDNIIAVSGTGFSDALSAAPIAAAKDEILLLTNNNANSMKNTAEFAKDSNVTVVGTTNVVSDSIYAQLKADKRINGGADRFDTNLNILNAFNNDLKTDKLYVANATGNGYADALVASAIAGKYAAPLVLTDTDISSSTNNALSYIGKKYSRNTDIQVIGGTGVISDRFFKELPMPVFILASSISFNKEEDTLTLGDTDTLIATVNPNNASGSVKGWKSSNSKVATVDSNGKITAVGLGTTTITVGIQDKTANCIVTVNAKDNNQVASFKDSNLEKVIRDTIDKPTGALYKNDVDNIVELNAGYNDLKDLSGIENLSSLKILNLASNKISDTSSLKKLSKLQDLNLSNNKISELNNLSELINLKSLDASYNVISDLTPLKRLINLENLNLSNNEINDLTPLKELIHLEYLYIYFNNIYNSNVDNLNKSLPNCNIYI